MGLFRHAFLLLALAASACAQDVPPAREPAPRFALPSPVATLAPRQTRNRRALIDSIHTEAAARDRQRAVRAAMLRLIGPLPARTELHPQVLGETRFPGLRLQKIVFESQPGFYVTALLYLPDSNLAGSRYPAILITPGHAASGKASDYQTALAFARNGFAVLSWDPLGQGERLQYPNPEAPGQSLAGRPTGEHGEAGLQPVLLGEALARYMLWDAMSGIDYLASRPEVDPSRIGAFGCSGGGAVTALLGALDPRVAALGTACYITSFDALLPAIGPQDAEQSTPGWLAAGLDFPDYIEAAAPKPYALIATTGDMFPFAGVVSTEREARIFYNLFNPPNLDDGRPVAGTTTGQSLAPSPLAILVGPGGHGNLDPILPRILKFFSDALHPPLLPPLEPAPAEPPPYALQVTATGQVSTDYPHAVTVFSLNLAHARALPHPHPTSPAALERAIAEVTGTPAHPLHGAIFPKPAPPTTSLTQLPGQPPFTLSHVDIPAPEGRVLKATLSLPAAVHAAPLALVLEGAPIPATLPFDHIVLTLPAPTPGTPDSKSPLVGPWYLPSLALQLTGRTLLGERLADTLAAADYLNRLPLPHQPGITAYAAGHRALVLLHAAFFDLAEHPILTSLILTGLPPSYADLLATPIPRDAAEDILPGVLLRYDTPDLLAALGPRVQQRSPSPQATPAALPQSEER